MEDNRILFFTAGGLLTAKHTCRCTKSIRWRELTALRTRSLLGQMREAWSLPVWSDTHCGGGGWGGWPYTNNYQPLTRLPWGPTPGDLILTAVQVCLMTRAMVGWGDIHKWSIEAMTYKWVSVPSLHHQTSVERELQTKGPLPRRFPELPEPTSELKQPKLSI